MTHPQPGVVGPSLLRSAGVLAALTLLARVVGFGRWLVFSKTVGDTCLGDVYTAANQLPNVLFEVVAGGVLAGVVIPVVARQVGVGDRAAVNRTTSALLTWTLLLLTPAGVAAILLAPVYGSVFVTPTCVGGVDRTAALVITFAPQVWLYGLAVVSAGVLQAHQRFVAAAVAPLVSSVVVIITYLVAGWVIDSTVGAVGRTDVRLTPDAAVAVLGWGTTAGVVALAACTLLIMGRLGLRVRPTLRLEPETAAVIRRIAVASLVGLLVQQATALIMTWVARGSAEPGAVTRLTWATSLYLLPYAVLAAPLIQAVFPRLAVAAGASTAAVDAQLRRTTPVLVVLACAGAAVLALSSAPVARVFVLGPGSGDTVALARPVLALAPAVVGYAVMIFTNRTLLAVHAARAAATVTVSGWAVAAIGVLLAGRLPASWVVTGIGAAVSLGLVVGAVVGWRLVRRAVPAADPPSPRPVLAGSAAVLLAGLAGVPVLAVVADAGAGVAVLTAAGAGLVALALTAGLVRLVAPTTYADAVAVLRRRVTR